MKLRLSFWRALICPLVALLVGCASDDPGSGDVLPGDPRFVRSESLDVENVSEHGAVRSHNAGLNCMNCHQPHGPGRGRFTVAGTLWSPDGTPHRNGTVHLTRTDPTLIAEGDAIDAVATVEADELGNFYSTRQLPLPEESLFVIVERSDGTGRNHMPFPTVSAACNVCHVGSNLVTVKE